MSNKDMSYLKINNMYVRKFIFLIFILAKSLIMLLLRFSHSLYSIDGIGLNNVKVNATVFKFYIICIYFHRDVKQS